MKHKLWLIMLTFVSTLCLTFGLSACGGEGGGTNHVHEPIRHEAQEATCTEDGNELYFECKNCHVLFLDESCTEKTTLAAVQKQATGHQAKSEWEQGDATHYHVCDVCGEKLSDTESAHDFGTAWESDENDHWQICAVCGKKGNEAAHDFGTGNVCTTCNYTEKAPSEGLLYQLDEEQMSYSVVGLGSCVDKDLVIPSMHEDLPVTSIGPQAFKDCSGLTSMEIPDSVTSIGWCAFYECSGLTSVTLGSGVTSINSYAFYGCSGLESIVVAEGNSVYHSKNNCLIKTDSHTLIAGCKNSIIPDDGSATSIGDYAFDGCSGLTSITIPDSVTSIGSEAFYKCSGLTSITIPDSVTRIEGYAFMDCSGLKSVTIGSGVTRIGRWAFYGCRGLESIVVAERNSVYHSKNNCLIKTDSHTLIAGCKNSIIPDDGSVTSIEECAFYGCSGLTGDLKIPDSVTSIGDSAFNGCSGLTSVTIPDSVTSIGSPVFAGCSGLESVTIGSGVTSIEKFAFLGCSGLKTVYYKGTAEEWKNISINSSYNSYLLNATRYYFTEDAPTVEEWASYDYWWHYDPDTSLPSPWVKNQ